MREGGTGLLSNCIYPPDTLEVDLKNLATGAIRIEKAPMAKALQDIEATFGNCIKCREVKFTIRGSGYWECFCGRKYLLDCSASGAEGVYDLQYCFRKPTDQKKL